jgi:SAM-dependent methyltransferase
MAPGEKAPPWLRPFGDDYRLIDLDSRPAAEAAGQVRCLERALDLHPGDAVLDIACATGRHSVLLAKHGYRVTGLDMNKDYLGVAEARAAAAGAPIRTVPGDMRLLSQLFTADFDAAFIMYSSFGYFPVHSDNVKVIAGVRDALKPGGRFLLDVINRDWFVRNYRSSDYVQPGDCFITRDFQVTGEQVLLHENVFRPAESVMSWSVLTADSDPLFTVTYRMYSVHEIMAIMAEAGLRVSHVLGGYDAEPFSLLSERILCVATRDDVIRPAG